MLKFLIFGSDDINHSNFENATVSINHDYLLKHVCFILELKDFCNTCVHFQWKKHNACRHDRDTVSAAHAWFVWQVAISWPNCVFAVARNCRVSFKYMCWVVGRLTFTSYRAMADLIIMEVNLQYKFWVEIISQSWKLEPKMFRNTQGRHHVWTYNEVSGGKHCVWTMRCPSCPLSKLTVVPRLQIQGKLSITRSLGPGPPCFTKGCELGASD